MFGVLLAGIGSVFDEFVSVVGKRSMRAKRESVYTYGFLTCIIGALFLSISGLVHGHLFFTLASLPTFVPRLMLEVLQAQLSVWAIMRADRGDYGLVRILTLPLLLTADLMLGYAITPSQIIGIVLIIVAVGLLLYKENFKTKALWILLALSINASITLSLYKWDITHFNSVEAEQSIITLVIALYFFGMAVCIKGENPLASLRKPLLALQSLAAGMSTFIVAFAYMFAPASVIATAGRGTAVLFAIISGHLYFRERRFGIKLLLFIFIFFGLVLLLY